MGLSGEVIERACDIGSLSGGGYEMVMLLPGAAVPQHFWGSPLRADILIVSDAGAAAAADAVSAGQVVTYGVSAKNTVTISSAASGECMIALQRGVTDIFGRYVEPQEIKERMRPELSLDELLAAAGAKLLLGGTFGK